MLSEEEKDRTINCSWGGTNRAPSLANHNSAIQKSKPKQKHHTYSPIHSTSFHCTPPHPPRTAPPHVGAHCFVCGSTATCSKHLTTSDGNIVLYVGNSAPPSAPSSGFPDQKEQVLGGTHGHLDQTRAHAQIIHGMLITDFNGSNG